MADYKLSRYNVFFERNGNKYLWNTLSDALIKLDIDGIDYIGNFDGHNDRSNMFKVLKENGCIVDKRYNELGKVLYDEKSTMLNSSPLEVHYTIAPGLGCNYKCPYCFEKDRTSRKAMTKHMQDKTCDFIIRKAENNPDLKHIGITWFGGEPLMYIDAIQYISKKLITFCNEHNIIYTAGIVTNGRFLTPENAEVLKECKVGYVQMAVDGTKYNYAKAKGTEPEEFDKVVENIVASADIIPITVRINVEDTIDDAIRLTDYLLRTKELDGKIKIYIAHIRNYSDTNMLKEQMSHEHFLNIEKEYIGFFTEGGIFSEESLAYSVPKRRCTTCLSVCDSNYCIGPEGEFYRCEHFFGNKEHVVGTIDAGRFYSDDEITYLKHIHPDKCEKCDLLPVCMGGCMNDNKAGNVALSCEHFKERMIDYLMLDV